jgi:hypothetical protein
MRSLKNLAKLKLRLSADNLTNEEGGRERSLENILYNFYVYYSIGLLTIL